MSASRTTRLLLASALFIVSLGTSASAESLVIETDTFGLPLMPEAPICGHCKSDISDGQGQVSLEVDLAGTVYKVGQRGDLSRVDDVIKAEYDASGAVVVDVFFAQGEWVVEVSPDRGDTMFYATREGETRISLKGEQKFSLVFIALADGGSTLPSPRTVVIETHAAAQR